MLVKVWKGKKDDHKRLDRRGIEGVNIDKTNTEDELTKDKELVFAALGVAKGWAYRRRSLCSRLSNRELDLHEATEWHCRIIRDRTKVQDASCLQAILGVKTALRNTRQSDDYCS